jgi:serine/threonine protein kinase
MKLTSNSDQNELPTLSTAQRSRLGELIDQYELAFDAGEPLSLEDLCEESPELLPHLMMSLQRLRLFDAKLSAVPSLPMLAQIGEFEVIEPLGTGATGMVFRCRQQNPEREVAVKVLKPLLDVDEQQRRFQREMAAVSAINEEGMAAVYQTGIVEWCGVRCLWIAMELLNNGTICEYVRKNVHSEERTLKLFQTICETLRAAHRIGILHRDIKPSNILMSDEGQPHIVDFGIARLPETFVNVHQTETGGASARGTAAWMAPELLLAAHPVSGDVRSEIFSLGVVLFEMISGQHPYAAEHLSVPQVSARIAKQQQASLSEVCPGTSADLIAFVGKLMAFDPDQRYQNLDDVLADLSRLLNGETVAARKVPAPERIGRWIQCHWRRVTLASVVGVAFLVTAGTLYELKDTQRRLTSTRTIATRYLRLLKELSIRPALKMPQTPNELNSQLEMLREAGLAFEEFLVQWPKDRQIREQAGSAFHMLGIAADRLGLTDEAFENFRRGVQIFTELQRDYPEDHEFQFDLFHTILGQAGAQLGTKESFQLHQLCLQMIRRLHQSEPDNAKFADCLACVLGEVAHDYTRPGSNKDLRLARKFATEAHELALRTCRDPEHNPLHRKHIATSASVLHTIAVIEGDPAEAQKWSAAAIYGQKQFTEHYTDPRSRAMLVRYFATHAEDSLKLQQLEAARESCDQATLLFEQIRESFQGFPEFPELESWVRRIQVSTERAAAADRPPAEQPSEVRAE